jgi:hypothetical protein
MDLQICYVPKTAQEAAPEAQRLKRYIQRYGAPLTKSLSLCLEAEKGLAFKSLPVIGLGCRGPKFLKSRTTYNDPQSYCARSIATSARQACD